MIDRIQVSRPHSGGTDTIEIFPNAGAGARLSSWAITSTPSRPLPVGRRRCFRLARYPCPRLAPLPVPPGARLPAQSGSHPLECSTFGAPKHNKKEINTWRRT